MTGFCQLKNSQNLRVKSCFIWWECLGLQAWETASQPAPRSCSEEAGEGGRLYIEVCNKEGRQSEHQRLLLIKENQMSQGTYCSSVYGKMQISGLTEVFPFICTSALWDQIPQSCFLSVHIFNSSFTERCGRRLLLLLTSSTPPPPRSLVITVGGGAAASSGSQALFSLLGAHSRLEA